MLLGSLLALNAVDMNALKRYKEEQGGRTAAALQTAQTDRSRIIVVFKRGASPEDLGAEEGFPLRQQKQLSERVYLFEVTDENGSDSLLKRLYESCPQIEHAEWYRQYRFERY